jgi:hypothetical protein
LEIIKNKKFERSINKGGIKYLRLRKSPTGPALSLPKGDLGGLLQRGIRSPFRIFPHVFNQMMDQWNPD